MFTKLVATFAATVLVPAFLYANRSLESTPLHELQALDDAPASVDVVKSAITAVNAHGLAWLPEAATLRAENAVAGVFLSVVR